MGKEQLSLWPDEVIEYQVQFMQGDSLDILPCLPVANLLGANLAKAALPKADLAGVNLPAAFLKISRG